jgi:hypothetical protein
VLHALYQKEGRLADFPALQAAYAAEMADSVNVRNNPPDDVESAAPTIYSFIKRQLGLTSCGNDQMAFARSVLAPLMKPGVRAYEELREDIFGLEER